LSLREIGAALREALREAKRVSKPRRFTQSVELIIALRDIDVRKPENRFTQVLPLPYKVGKGATIGVFASGDLYVRAKELGAELIVSKEELERIGHSKKEARKLAKACDFYLAEGPLMPLVARTLGRFLGPRGRMPQPVTASTNLNEVFDRLRRSVLIRLKDQPQIQVRIGKEGQPEDEIIENALTVLEFLADKLPRGLKNIERMYVKLTQGPAVQVRWKR